MKKKKSSGNGFIILFLIACILVAAYFIYRNFKNEINFVRYDEFGIDIPINYKIHGIDVSKFQGEVNWNAVKQMQVEDIKLTFAFIKATEGITRQDAQFKRNWQKAKKAGVIRGAYHFFYATRDPMKQVINFRNTVDLEPGDLPPVLDIEVHNDQTPAVIRSMAKIWLEEMEEVYGVKPIIYTNMKFYDTYLGDEFDQYPLWVAHYYQKEKPKASRSWLFWQHSDIGRVNGIRNKVDFNVFRGDSASLMKLCLP
ncbi:lysozyme [Chitinophaga skermanii]|uniref:Lysozyme n=1 Tax=Chitinophaga skermanii TaxID=331697 RepID=A0A327QC94_9BACT|nr:glycoside hydrolase family 25 protein [Chitinophaga skermanii]RAJ01488.1 lysozyme [Chitinophaga skermanii]